MNVTTTLNRSADLAIAWRYRQCPGCDADAAQVLHQLPLPPDPLDAQTLYACTSTTFGRGGLVVRCTRCGLIYLNPQPPRDVITESYRQVVDWQYEAERAGRIRTFTRSLDQLARYADGGRLLDVGCHVGIFLELAAARGWEVYGVEPSWWAAARARQRGLAVVTGTLQEASFPSRWFDAVTMWDVVEHFVEPLANLREAARLLKPGGLLAISTMNVESLIARLLGPRWPWFMPMHLVYFSPRTLGDLLHRAHFDLIAVEPHRRVVSVRYLISRLGGRWPRLAAWLDDHIARPLDLGSRFITVDLGDVMTVFARRRPDIG